MHWRIHERIADARLDELVALLTAEGDTVQVVRGRAHELPSAPKVGYYGAPGLALTTLQDARDLPWAAVPGAYWSADTYRTSYYLPRLHAAVPVLNRGGVFLPFGMLGDALRCFPEAELFFVRPDSGQKPFPGQTLPRADFEAAHRQMARTYKLEPECLCYCARPQAVASLEWRLWIVDREIVAWTPYSWDTSPSWAPLPPAIREAAAALLANSWQPDRAYVADFGFTEGDDTAAYLLELNAASTSGLYQVPFEALIPALRNAALADSRESQLVE